MKPHGDRRHTAKILVWQGLSTVNRGIDDSSGRAIPRKGIDMWIRRTVRLLVVALLATEISIITLASAASAAPPDEEPRQAPAPIVRVYHFGGALEEAPRWYGALEMAAVSLEDVYYARLAEQRRPLPVPLARHQSHAPEIPESATTWQRPEATGNRRRPEVAGNGQRPESLTNRQRPEAVSNWQRSARLRSAKQERRPAVDLNRAVPRRATVHLTHTHATRWLKSAGLQWKSTGNCASKHLHYCTSLDSVRTSTVARAVALKKRSHCPIMVTGGTETGHAPGPFSHGSGYKLDISHNECIDRYINQHHDLIGTRSDGARLYRSGSGTIFADEGDHWDILFR